MAGQGNSRPIVALLFIFLLGSQEALASRAVINLNSTLTAHARRSAGGVQGRASTRTDAAGATQHGPGHGLGPDALGRLEKLYEQTELEVQRWWAARADREDSSEGSLAEMYAHLDRTVLSGGASVRVNEQVVAEAMQELRSATDGVENLNLFLCKRSVISNYRDIGPIFEKRELQGGSFEVRCTARHSILRHGKAGGEVEGREKDKLVKAIDTLKGLTKLDDKAAEESFNIRLKLCTRPGGCRTSQPQQGGKFADSQEDIFGDGGLTEQIPIPEHLKEFLPRVKHNEGHRFAICFDDQDDCDGMMWVPRSLHSCTGWFKAKDTRVSLGQLRDAVTSGWWGRFWTPSGRQRLQDSLGKKGKDITKEEEVLGEVTAVNKKKQCPRQEWQESEHRESEQDLREVRAALREAVDKREGLRQQAKRLQGKDQAQVRALQAQADERHQAAVGVCREAEEAGEGSDCQEDEHECKKLAKECQKLLQHPLQPLPCRSREEMQQLLQASQGKASSELQKAGALAQGSEAGQEGGELYYSRRRRRMRPMGDILFPPYYYHHHPYCYSWYGGYHGFYAYPVMPNVGGFTFGLGTFDPTLMAIEGMGHLVYHTARGLAYVASGVGDALSWGGGGGGSFDCGDLCIAGIFLVILLIVLVVVIYAVKHCSKNEEACHSWWYRGGRMRKKAKKWMKLWNGLEDHVQQQQNAYLLFDAHANTAKLDRCIKELQWGREWVGRADTRWVPAPSS